MTSRYRRKNDFSATMLRREKNSFFFVALLKASQFKSRPSVRPLTCCCCTKKRRKKLTFCINCIGSCNQTLVAVVSQRHTNIKIFKRLPLFFPSECDSPLRYSNEKRHKDYSSLEASKQAKKSPASLFLIKRKKEIRYHTK